MDSELSDTVFDEKYGQLFEPPQLSREYNSGKVTWGQTWPIQQDEGCYFTTLVQDYNTEKLTSSLVRVIEARPGMLKLFRFKLRPETSYFSWEIQKDF